MSELEDFLNDFLEWFKENITKLSFSDLAAIESLIEGEGRLVFVPSDADMDYVTAYHLCFKNEQATGGGE